MATKTSSKPHYATREFNDAGTTRRFTAGEELKDLTEGEIGNYVAAGIASTDKPKPAGDSDTVNPGAPPG